MRRRVPGRDVPLEELLEPFWRDRPLLSEDSTPEEKAADRELSKRMYEVAEAHGYDKLDVIRAGVYRTHPRYSPTKKRGKLKGHGS